MAERLPAHLEAGALLRRAERHGQGGSAVITAAPAIIDRLHKAGEWIEQLSRRRGGAISLKADPSLGILAGHVA